MVPAAAIALLLAATPAEMESAAARAVSLEFERVGRQTPVPDPALTQAARSLAYQAVMGAAADAADSLAIAEAVSDANAADPVPRAVVVRASPADEVLRALQSRRDYADDSATHVGIGVALQGELAALVVLLSDRKALLQPFPRKVAKVGAPLALCGELVAPLAKAQVFVTRPDGTAQKVALSRDDGPRFCASIALPAEGRYTLEAVGTGSKGPEVAGLFFCDVGRAVQRSERSRTPEPTTVPLARAALVDRINGLRRAHDVESVIFDDALSRVAQAYADEMKRDHFFSHVAPDGKDMRARLKAAGYLYEAAGENLGLANGPLAAHFGIEHSPGHRKNLLEPAFTHVGVGVTLTPLADRTQAIVVELFATPAHVSATPLADAYRAVQDKRQGQGLPMLIRSEVLERLALDHAARALAEDTPKAHLPDSSLHERVFEALDEAKSAAVDVFVLDEPGLVSESKSLKDPSNDRVGIGAVKGDSASYGRAKWWVVVIYASTRDSRKP